jgi:hypothetical protein
MCIMGKARCKDTNFLMFYKTGATLGRGLNRGLATLVAGALGFGAHHLASLSGEKGQPIVLGLFVFLLGKNS